MESHNCFLSNEIARVGQKLDDAIDNCGDVILSEKLVNSRKCRAHIRKIIVCLKALRDRVDD